MLSGWKRTSAGFAAVFAIAGVIYWRSDLVTAGVRAFKQRLHRGESGLARGKLAFTEVVHGIYVDKNGFNVAVFGSKSSDGGSVDYYLLTPVGSANGADEFERRLAEADYVVTKESLKNAQGLEVGQRAIILFRGRRADQEIVAVLLNYGRELRSIESESLYDVLEFEKQKCPR